jgi:hypothetical protein
MNYKINCSIGEIIDKITILNIKLEHSINDSQTKNIKKEIELLTNDCQLIKTNDDLFLLLKSINNKLWNYEDEIREKSQNKEFDQTFINIATNIHKTNDLRYKIKRQINEKYNSNIIEEKIYKNTNQTNTLNIKDMTYTDHLLLTKVKNEWTEGNFDYSYKLILPLIETYKNYDIKNEKIADLFVSYQNCISTLGETNLYANYLTNIYNNINNNCYTNEFKSFFVKIYFGHLLQNGDYKKGLELIHHTSSVNNTQLNVNKQNMSFFKSNDKNKSLLVYWNGGLGDTFMYARFIPMLCHSNTNNNIIFAVQNNILWLYTKLFSNIPNLTITTLQQITHFDYHCSLEKSLFYLNIDSPNKILFEPYINTQNLNQNINEELQLIINRIKQTNKKSYVINWHGNYSNSHEKHNRGIELTELRPIFKNNNYNWIIITKEINNKELKFLEKFSSTIIINKELPNYDKISFNDTMTIFNNVDGVISTDTSLIHLAASMDIPTTVLLTKGYEWRWSNNHWYPNIEKIIQTKTKCWDSVIQTLLDKFK